jgi:hypothetical protein
MRAFVLLAFFTAAVNAAVKVIERPMVLYSSVSPKLRIQTEGPTFAGEKKT